MRPFLLILAAIASPTCWAATGTLKTDVNPGRAGVFVDGKYLGPAKNLGKTRTYTVEAGDHEIRFTEPRYEDLVKKITIPAGGTLAMKEVMVALPEPKPPFGLLRVLNPDKFAAVYINGKFMGHVGEFDGGKQGLKLNPGTYELQIVPTAGPPIMRSLTIEADKTTVAQ